jgi:hypothetical protein
VFKKSLGKFTQKSGYLSSLEKSDIILIHGALGYDSVETDG